MFHFSPFIDKSDFSHWIIWRLPRSKYLFTHFLWYQKFSLGDFRDNGNNRLLHDQTHVVSYASVTGRFTIKKVASVQVESASRDGLQEDDKGGTLLRFESSPILCLYLSYTDRLLLSDSVVGLAVIWVTLG